MSIFVFFCWCYPPVLDDIVAVVIAADASGGCGAAAALRHE